MNICVIVPFYQDYNAGVRLYENIHEYGLQSYWADGRFPNFQQINNSDISTDGLREFIQSKPDAELVTKDEGVDEMFNKLNKLLDSVGEKYDYVILMGCDELFEGDFDVLLNNLAMYDVGVPALYRVGINETDITDMTRKDAGIERVMYKPERFRVNKAHWRYFVDGIQCLSYEKLIDGVIIKHDRTIRPKKRDDMMNDYQSINKHMEIDRLWKDVEKIAIEKRKNQWRR